MGIVSILLNEKITDNVFAAVWLAALVMTYEEKLLKKNDNIYFEQKDIQEIAQKLCTKTVHPARVHQWCNGDHPKCNYKYLRAVGSKRRLTQMGEFGDKVYPEKFIDSDTQIFIIPHTREKVTFGDLFEWYSSNYSKTFNGDVPLKEELIESNNYVDRSNSINLQEDEIKLILSNYLNANGWETKLAMGKVHGIDIDATKGSDRWIIEVKGCGSRNAMRVNYFLAILGETLQRMSDPNAKYSIALPNMKQYRNLWERLPQLAKERTGISVIFVSEDNQIEEVN